MAREIRDARRHEGGNAVIRAFALAATIVASAAFAADPPAQRTASGLEYTITSHGTGPGVHDGQVIVAHYTGRLVDGKVFDSSLPRKQPIAFKLGAHQVIPGWEEGFALLHVGDKASFVIPPNLAYGEKGYPPVIPPNATLTFDVELVEVHERGLADALSQAIDAGGVPEAKKVYDGLIGTDFAGYYVSEGQLNGLGYRLMGKAKMDAAIAVLRWTTERFPQSANAFDSLGEALAKAGDRDGAIKSYRRALEIDPKFENAAKELERLEANP